LRRNPSHVGKRLADRCEPGIIERRHLDVVESNHRDIARNFQANVLQRPNRRLYITDENQENTYSAAVGDDGRFTDVKLFAEIGGESVAEDVEGNVYIAAGQIFVYNPSGERIGTIEVPERPSQILFGGADRKTLFIAARSSLYAVQMRNAGR